MTGSSFFVRMFVLFVLVGCSGTSGSTHGDAGNDLARDRSPSEDTPAIDSTGDGTLPCASGNRCGDTCVSLDDDPRHCGACNNVCAPGERCVAGLCRAACPPGQSTCDGRCVNTDTDQRHCGACGNACPEGQVCSMGRCDIACRAPTIVCEHDAGTPARACVDPRVDREHCGRCDVRCAPGEVCAEGRCVSLCSAGQSPCEGRCVDLQFDRSHCGACGNACPEGLVCNGGTCVAVCPGGQLRCEGVCRDVAIDPTHCGRCNNTCPPGTRCERGACRATCGGGLSACGLTCHDLQSDNAHCGACDNACPAGQVCRAGRCEIRCPEGSSACGGVCRDLATDRLNCGACGVACPAGQVCAMGRCTADCTPPNRACAGTCRDVMNDPAHCGGCGTTCAAGEVCVRGVCTTACVGRTNCGGLCVDLMSDREHCGACGMRCPSWQSCTGGRCTCPMGRTECGGYCIDLGIDPNNCGRCGMRCPAGQFCVAGACTATCGMLSNCAGVCVDLQNDNLNCGACGRACAITERCMAGTCTLVCTGSLRACGSPPTCVDLTRDPLHCGTCGNTCLGGCVPTGNPTTPGRCARPVDVYAGVHFACVRYESGRVRCWGNGGSSAFAANQISTGHTAVSQPVIGSMGAAVVVSSMGIGDQNGCGANSDGRVVCWGASYSGTGGFPNHIGGITDARQVSFRGEHGCAVLATGNVVCWGTNTHGQLGDGTTTTRIWEPAVPVVGLSGVVRVAAGWGHSCALRGDGRVFCWGLNTSGQLGDGSTTNRTTPVATLSLTNAVALWVGDQSSCARVSDGRVFCWGRNAEGQLGDGTTSNRTMPTEIPAWRDATAMSLGRGTTCAILRGEVHCTGANAYGQVGDGSTTNRSTPVRVGTLTNTIAIDVGTGFACALDRDANVRCWGRDEYGQIGIRHELSPVPRTVMGLSNVRQLDAGSDYVCARLGDGTIRCWGSLSTNTYGQFGNGTVGNNPLQGLVTVSGIRDATEIALSPLHACALRTGGQVACWGYAPTGALGHRLTMLPEREPTPVSAMVSNATSVDVGLYHSCAIVASRDVFCWGSNTYGEIGDGTIGIQRAPTRALLATGEVPVELGLGRTSSCVRLSNGQVRCWGDNREYALGDGTTTNSYVPIPVRDNTSTSSVPVSLTGVVRLIGGNINGAAALLSDNRLFTWGGYNFGGSTYHRYASPVGSAAGVTHLFLRGDWTGCAVLAGEAYCSGSSNEYGVLGNGMYYTHVSINSTQSILPFLLPALRVASGTRRYTQAVALSNGLNACALATDGTVDCWGYVSGGFLNVTGLDHLVRVPSTVAMVGLYP